MLKKKHVVLHTSARIDDARQLLQAQTLAGPSSADDLAALMKDTLSTDPTPFRGEVEASTFKLTRRVRGQRVRIQLTGALEAKPDGSTEIRASMAPPPTLTLSLWASLLVVMIMSGGLALAGGPLWLLLLLAQLPVLGFASALYDAETSKTFSALRDAIPERPLPAIAPISNEEAEHAPAAAPRLPLA